MTDNTNNNDMVMFSKFPSEMDEFFVNNEILIKLFPDDLIDDLESKIEPLRISNTQQFYDFLETEIQFWNKNDDLRKLYALSKKERLDRASVTLSSALSAYSRDDINSGKKHLSDSVRYLNEGVLYSKTALANYLISNYNKDKSFFEGFKYGIEKNRSNLTLSSSANVHEGFFAALEYRKIIEDIHVSSELIDALNDNINKANYNYSELNSNYTKSFHEHEMRVEEFNNKILQYLEDFSTGNEALKKELIDNITNLEKTYDEKLKLESPAKYWKELGEEYNKKGNKWLLISIVASLVVIVLLLVTIKIMPNLFSENVHWLDAFKNSAIITIIASVSIYTLRILVKLAMSSFHLARDAKEREQLSYFYLALNEKKAVTDNERAIILNSLFSRSDTGLLKGDSSPVMSGDIVSLIAKYNRPQ